MLISTKPHKQEALTMDSEYVELPNSDRSDFDDTLIRLYIYLQVDKYFASVLLIVSVEAGIQIQKGEGLDAPRKSLSEFIRLLNLQKFDVQLAEMNVTSKDLQEQVKEILLAEINRQKELDRSSPHKIQRGRDFFKSSQ